jgi:magnesium transporter
MSERPRRDEVAGDPGGATPAGGPGPGPDAAVVDCAVYAQGQRRHQGRSPVAGVLRAAQEADGFAWIGLHEPSAEQLAAVATEFGLHPLAVEDALHARQRPKLEGYGEMLFAVLKTARYVEHTELTEHSEVVETGEVMVFMGPGFVVTVRHGSPRPLDGVRRDLEAQPELLAHGPAAALYAVADRVVNDYLAVAADVECDVENVEAAVFEPGQQHDPHRFYQLKRELLELKRAVLPLARPLQQLSTAAAPQVDDELRAYFRDVHDHLLGVVEQVASLDDLLNTILAAHLAQVAVRQNQDMRKISAVVAILAVPTMLAGIYGMNFDHMPELHWVIGYPLVLAVMATACAVLYRGFRKSGWL